MNPKILKKTEKTVTLEVTMKLEGSMLEMEEQIQKSLNEVGKKATSYALERFDTNGESIEVKGKKLTSKGKKKGNKNAPWLDKNLSSCISR